MQQLLHSCVCTCRKWRVNWPNGSRWNEFVLTHSMHNWYFSWERLIAVLRTGEQSDVSNSCCLSCRFFPGKVKLKEDKVLIKPSTNKSRYFYGVKLTTKFRHYYHQNENCCCVYEPSSLPSPRPIVKVRTPQCKVESCKDLLHGLLSECEPHDVRLNQGRSPLGWS